MNISSNINNYLYADSKNNEFEPTLRNASFDYCFNYFQSFREDAAQKALASGEHLETSCLHLGFYLASWGMLRGSSFLLNKSVKFYEAVISTIADMPPVFWEIDVDCYTHANIDLLLKCKQKITDALGSANNPSDTLVTKIMLGVFGSIPAFDTNVTAGFKKVFGMSSLSVETLENVAGFYNTNKVTIDAYHIPTLDFKTGLPTKRTYTRAKIVDMIFFSEGSISN
jgi:hypothetical protein